MQIITEILTILRVKAQMKRYSDVFFILFVFFLFFLIFSVIGFHLRVLRIAIIRYVTRLQKPHYYLLSPGVRFAKDR